MKVEAHKMLKKLRQDNKLTQQQMADICMVELRTYQDYERGQMMPQIKSVVKLVEHFGVSSDYILFGQLEGEKQ